jgi:hypothetical protein
VAAEKSYTVNLNLSSLGDILHLHLDIFAYIQGSFS